MNSLIIDTHLNDILVFLLNDGKVLFKEEIYGKKNNSEVMFPTIIKLIDGKRIDEIIIINGPGSFTSVRLGVTIAKTLAYTLNIPIKTISSLETFAISSNSLNVAINDGNGCYIGMFDDNFNKISDFTYVSTSDYNNMAKVYNEEYVINPERVYEHLKFTKPINAHGVKPLYVKKIGVEIDKESNL